MGRVSCRRWRWAPNRTSTTYDPLNGNVYVPDYYANNVSVISTWNPVAFSEAGLPNGTDWWVNTSGGATPVSNTTTLTVPLPNGAFSYSVGTSNRTWSAPSGTILVNGSSTPVAVTFTPQTYPIAFVESGLPAGTEWTVTLDGIVADSTGPQIHFSQVNATYDYTVGPISGWSTAKTSGSLAMAGFPLTETVTWFSVTYPVEFAERGLPIGSGWWVNATRTLSMYTGNATVTFSEPNGTYSYSVGSSNRTFEAPSGFFTVDGTGDLEYLNFSLSTYPVLFTEAGLSGGTPWSVLIGGDQFSSSTATIRVPEANGSYGFTVPALSGFLPSPGSGTIAVSGGVTNQTVLFLVVAPSAYSVTFSETGLPSGLTWTADFNGTSRSSMGAIVFSGIANGTYRFSIAAVGSNVPAPKAGLLSVNGSAASRTITFRGPVSAPSTLLGLPGTEGFEVFGAVAGLLIAGALVGVMTVRRRAKRALSHQTARRVPAGTAPHGANGPVPLAPRISQ